MRNHNGMSPHARRAMINAICAWLENDADLQMTEHVIKDRGEGYGIENWFGMLGLREQLLYIRGL